MHTDCRDGVGAVLLVIRAGGGGLRVSGFGLPAAAGSNFRGGIRYGRAGKSGTAM